MLGLRLETEKQKSSNYNENISGASKEILEGGGGREGTNSFGRSGQEKVFGSKRCVLQDFSHNIFP